MTPTNKQRGEVKIEGPDGKDLKMCLTLGAMSMLEEELGIESLTEIDSVMKKSKTKHLIIILQCLCAGGGNPVADEDMMTWQIDFQVLISKIRDCFQAAGFGEEEEEGEEKGKE